jgi:hypothetical protein
MKYFLMLAAAASLAACHNRSEDEVGAAPDQGDTTAVVADTSMGVPTDSTMGQVPTDSSYVQDTTTTTTGVDSSNAPTSTGNAPTDTLSQPTGDTTGAAPSDTGATGEYTDTTSTTGDTTGMGQPSDSAPSQ